MPFEEFEDGSHKNWAALRHEWPYKENVWLHIKDCRYKVYGKAFYNGWDFQEIEWEKPRTGSLLLITYLPTHWCYMRDESEILEEIASTWDGPDELPEPS